eukprot:3424979-Prorocentrum_lima.AAC.1
MVSAPALTHSLAIARPSPRLPPVMSTRLPCKQRDNYVAGLGMSVSFPVLARLAAHLKKLWVVDGVNVQHAG